MAYGQELEYHLLPDAPTGQFPFLNGRTYDDESSWIRNPSARSRQRPPDLCERISPLQEGCKQLFHMLTVTCLQRESHFHMLQFTAFLQQQNGVHRLFVFH